MVIGRQKLARALKLFSIFAYLLYFFITNTNIFKSYDNFHLLKTDNELKIKLLSNKCLLLLGGSNVVMGLSAEITSIKSCEALNLGINNEGGGFNKYIRWLNPINLADKVIYSPALIWQSSLSVENNEGAEVKFPSTSLFSFLIKILLNKNDDISIEFNQFGDRIKYQCLNNFPSYTIRTNEFIESSHLINKEIYHRILILMKLTNSSDLFIRVPPVYVKNKNQAELYNDLMNERIKLLKDLGVKIVGSTFVSTDRSLFCDSFHPNAAGREQFTKEIILPQ